MSFLLKKYKYPLIALILFILMIMIIINGFTANQNMDMTNDTQSSNSAQALSSTIYEKGFILDAPESFDELIGDSDLIVVGTVNQAKAIGRDTDEYTIKVDKLLKDGNRVKPNQVYVYQYSGTLKENGQYVLFLRESGLAYYPEPNYRAIDTVHIIGVQQEKLYHRSPLIENDLSLTALEQQIENSYKINAMNLPLYAFPDVPKHPPKFEDMINNADLIAHVKIESARHETMYSKLVDLNIIHMYKNDLQLLHNVELNQVMSFMPASVINNEEYLLLAQYHDGVLLTLSVEGSVISKRESKEWNRAIKQLEKHQLK